MTIDQLHNLNEDELSLILYIVNYISPPCVPKMEFRPKHLLWFRHPMLIQKIFDSFLKLKPEGHEIFKSLLLKLGVQAEIKKIESTPTEVTSSVTSPEISTNPPHPIINNDDTHQTGSSEITSSI
jgi:hypothetical protein